jgi:hypothetical protein
MNEFWMRVMDNMSERVTGPMHLRLILQPVMASIFAVIAGFKDAKLGKPPYFWSLAHDAGHRAYMLEDGWKSVGKVYVLAILLDVVFQVKVLGTVYPGGALFVAFVLAIVPYLILRGTVTRMMR